MSATRVTLKNIKSLQLMQNEDLLSTGVAVDPITGGMCVGGNVDITGGLSVSTMKLGTGSITDTSGSITFSSTNIIATSGNITTSSGDITTTSGTVNSGNITIGTSTITSSDNLISFAGTSIHSTGGANISGGVSLSGGASIGPLFIADNISNVLNDRVLIINGNNGQIGTSAFPAGGSGGTTNPSGSNTQIQYNNNNSFGADSSFTWTQGTSTLGVSGIVDVTKGPIILNESTGGVSVVVIESISSNSGADITLFEHSTPGAPTQGMQFRTDGTTGENSIFINNFDGGGGITNTDGIIISSKNSGSNNPYIDLNRNENTSHTTNPDIRLLSDDSGPNSSSKIIMNADTAGTGNGPIEAVILESGAQNGVAAQGAVLTMRSSDGTTSDIITLDTTTYQISINNNSAGENVLIQGGQGTGTDSGQIIIKDGSNRERIKLKGSDNLIDFDNGGATLTFGMSGSQIASTSFILPTGSGNNGDVLSTDGAGNLSYIGTSGFGVSELGELNDAFTDTSNNIILGPQPKTTTISGANNTAVGISALFDITSGTSNTVVGYNAGVSLTSGSANVAIGDDSLNTETVGIGSVAVGYNTLSGQLNNTSANVYNTAVGWGAGSGLTSGTSCTFIGASTGILPGISGHNITCLGFGAQPSGTSVSNEVTLGNNQIQTLRCAEATIASLSDARDKNDIRDLSYGLNFLENVRPVEFTWDRRVLTPDDENDPKQGKRRAGFIAQELQEAMPDGENDILDLVYTSNPQRLEAKYGNLIPVMVKAIQDLKQEVDTIKEHLNLE